MENRVGLATLLVVYLVLIKPTHSGRAFPHPVGFWMFDKQFEGNDLSGNGNDAELYNTEWMSGPWGTPDRAMKFTGADDQSSYARIPNLNRKLSVTDSFTFLTMFIDLATSDEGPIYTMGREKECCGHIIWKCCYTSSGLHARFDNRYPATGSAISVNKENFFTQDEWMKLAITYNQGDGVMKTYEDGEERVDMRASYTGLLDDDYDYVRLGSRETDTRELTAGILCTMYFDVALTQEELSAAYSLCLPIEYRSLYPWPHAKAHWPMNSYHGINNAADGINKNGVAKYYSIENGPYGEEGGSFFFRQSFDSHGIIDNADGQLDVNSFTLTAWFKPGNARGPIFRIWEDAAGDTSAPHIWNNPDQSQLYYAHYSETDGAVKGTVSSDTGVLKIRKWNYIAVVYNYGQGMSYLYANDVMVKSYSHGSHVTKMGPALGIIEYGNPSTLYNRDSGIACVQWHDMPLSHDAIQRVKNECKTNRKDYKPTPSLIFPITKEYSLKEMSPAGRKAVSNNQTSWWWTGPRGRAGNALALWAEQTITFPPLTTRYIHSFTFAVHYRQNGNDIIEFVEDLIKADGNDITVSIGGVDHTTAGQLERYSWRWIGVVYDGYLGVYTLYIDGIPEVSRFIGHHVITLDQVKLHNYKGNNPINCYQFYEEALSLVQFVHTRDACIVYTDEHSLPYPVAFWPLTQRYGLREITGRSPDLQTLSGSESGVHFNEAGPFGDANGALYLDGPTNDRAVLFADAHRSLDVKFSATAVAWVKYPTSLSTRTCILGFRFTSGAEAIDKQDSGLPGFLFCSMQLDGKARMYMRTTQRNSNHELPSISNAVSYFDDHLQPLDQWMHVAGSYDFHTKTYNLFVNGQLLVSGKLPNRYISKTDLTLTVGSKIDYDEANDMTSQSFWTSNQIMTCLQLYDVALSEPQVKRTMDLCKSEVLDSSFKTNNFDGKRLKDPQQTVNAVSLPQCLLMCQSDSTCQQAAYGDSQCHLDPRESSNLTWSHYRVSTDTLLEKEETPWKLFV